jgi:hypothetical protein
VTTEGLTLLGAGSEWFWSMLQFVVVAVTLVGIYIQMRQARAANAFNQAAAIEREWVEERLVRRRLAMLTALRDEGPGADLTVLMQPIGNYWEQVAALVRAGHVELPVVYDALATDCRTWWSILGPSLLRYRAEVGDDTILEHFEWLARSMERLDATQLTDDPYTFERVMARLPVNIARLRVSLDDFEAMRTVIAAPAHQADSVAISVPMAGT